MMYSVTYMDFTETFFTFKTCNIVMEHNTNVISCMFKQKYTVAFVVLIFMKLKNA
jgi:hypothetical protein